MSIYHYASQDKEIQFLSNAIRINMEKYFQPLYHLFDNDYKNFLKTQKERERQFDLSILTSHGATSAILSKDDDGLFSITIGQYDYKAFLGNIILSISCYTAADSGFGEYLVERGAITYIGFNTSIEKDFIFEKLGQFQDDLNKIFSSIYATSISLALRKMIYEMKSAQQFVDFIDYYFRNLATDITFKSIEEINSEFGTTFDDEQQKKLTVTLFDKFNILNEKLVLLGDKNSIAWDSINYIGSIDQIDNVYTKIRAINDKNKRYKTKLITEMIIKALQIVSSTAFDKIASTKE